MTNKINEEKLDEIDKLIFSKTHVDSQISNLYLKTYLSSQGFEVSLEEVAQRRIKLEIMEGKREVIAMEPLTAISESPRILDKLLDASKSRGRVDQLIIHKLRKKPSISNSELRTYLVSHDVYISIDDVARKRTEIEREVKVQPIPIKRSSEVKTTAKLSLVGGFCNFLIGGFLLLLWTPLWSTLGMIPQPVRWIWLLLIYLGPILFTLGIAGFGIAYDFWNEKEWAWNLGLTHAIACIIVGILTLPIGSISVAIYGAILYYLAKPDVHWRFSGA